MRFVVIGGIAARLLGSPTVTRDTDICYERTPENLERLAAALEELGAKLRGVDEEVPFLLDAKTLAAGDHFTFETQAGDFDVLGTPAGVEGFDELVQRAEAVRHRRDHRARRLDRRPDPDEACRRSSEGPDRGRGARRGA